MKIGTVIKQNRQTGGFTQIELARRVAVQATYLSAVENDKKEENVELGDFTWREAVGILAVGGLVWLAICLIDAAMA